MGYEGYSDPYGNQSGGYQQGQGGDYGSGYPPQNYPPQGQGYGQGGYGAQDQGQGQGQGYQQGHEHSDIFREFEAMDESPFLEEAEGMDDETRSRGMFSLQNKKGDASMTSKLVAGAAAAMMTNFIITQQQKKGKNVKYSGLLTAMSGMIGAKAVSMLLKKKPNASQAEREAVSRAAIAEAEGALRAADEGKLEGAGGYGGGYQDQSYGGGQQQSFEYSQPAEYNQPSGYNQQGPPQQGYGGYGGYPSGPQP